MVDLDDPLEAISDALRKDPGALGPPGLTLYAFPSTAEPYLSRAALQRGAIVRCSILSMRSIVNFSNVGETVVRAMQAMGETELTLLEFDTNEIGGGWSVLMQGSGVLARLTSLRYFYQLMHAPYTGSFYLQLELWGDPLNAARLAKRTMEGLPKEFFTPKHGASFLRKTGLTEDQVLQGWMEAGARVAKLLREREAESGRGA